MTSTTGNSASLTCWSPVKVSVSTWIKKIQRA